jgi:pSer/pThr/pTyr-binding forkhead associated (FHA) protein
MSNTQLTTTNLAIPDLTATWSSRPIVVTVQGPQGKQVYTIDKPFVRIGAHPRSEVVLPDGPAKRFFLHATGAGIYCLSLERNVLGRPPFNGWVAPRRAISIGAYQVSARFADDAPQPDRGTPDQGPDSPATVRPRLELTTVSGRRQTVQLHLRRPLTIVGREPPSKLCLADSSISRVHCILYWDDARLWAIDLFSANGTQIDGRAADFGIMPPGSTLVLGNIRLTHVSDSQGQSTQQGEGEPESSLASPVPAAAVGPPTVVGSDTLVLSAHVAPVDGAADGAPVDDTRADGEGRQEPLAVDAPCNSKPLDSQRFQTPAPATIDALRREARQQAEQQAEEWAERRDALLAEIAGLRAELTEAKHQRDLAQSQRQEAEQAQAAISARLSDLELAHRELELANRELELAHNAAEEQLAAALNREAQHRRAQEEWTAQREAAEYAAGSAEAGSAEAGSAEAGSAEADSADADSADADSADADSADADSADAGDAEADSAEADGGGFEDGNSENRVAQRQLVVWQAERKLLIDELLRPLCGEVSAAVSETGDDPVDPTATGDEDRVPGGGEQRSEPPEHGPFAPAGFSESDSGDWLPPTVDAANDSSPPVVSRKDPAIKTIALGDDELFDQLVNAQARQSRAQGRRRLLATAAIGGTTIVALAVAAYFAWQPLVRLLNW